MRSSLCALCIFMSVRVQRVKRKRKHLGLCALWHFVFLRQYSYKLILDNILVFVPFGMLFPNLPGKNQKHKLLISAAAGMAFSVMIESVQYAFSLGCTELDDVINNTIGTIVGCGIFALGEKISRNGKKTVLQPGWQKSLIPAAAVCAVMFFMDVYREYILFGKM